MVQAWRDDRWPLYLPGPRHDILAMGVISLTYGQLENLFRTVFSLVADMNEYQIAAIFERMPNNHRLSALAQMLGKTTLPEVLKERVSHFCNGFRICAENRHAIMHSHSGRMYTSYSRNERGILLTKYSRSGNKLICAASLAELRRVADQAHEYAVFGMHVATEIRIFRLHLERGEEDEFSRVYALPDK